MVLVEAMASGRPVITTESGSIPEVVGDAALLVRPYSVDDLASAIALLATDSSRRRELAAAGRRHVVSHYDSRVVASQIAAAYRHLLAV